MHTSLANHNNINIIMDLCSKYLKIHFLGYRIKGQIVDHFLGSHKPYIQ